MSKLNLHDLFISLPRDCNFLSLLDIELNDLYFNAYSELISAMVISITYHALNIL